MLVPRPLLGSAPGGGAQVISEIPEGRGELGPGPGRRSARPAAPTRGMRGSFWPGWTSRRATWSTCWRISVCGPRMARSPRRSCIEGCCASCLPKNILWFGRGRVSYHHLCQHDPRGVVIYQEICPIAVRFSFYQERVRSCCAVDRDWETRRPPGMVVLLGRKV